MNIYIGNRYIYIFTSSRYIYNKYNINITVIYINIYISTYIIAKNCLKKKVKKKIKKHSDF